MYLRILYGIVLGSALLLTAAGVPLRANDSDGWQELSTEDFSAWRGQPKKQWIIAGDAALDPANPRKLIAKPGHGVLINGKGRVPDLLSKEKFGDMELHLEFMVPQRSNSGVKFHGHYEIQIHDSYGVKNLDGEHCGGIYPRAEMKPRYHHIDKGIAPKVNACKAPGEWQTLDAIFLAPRFDKDGKKIASARLLKAVLNGQVIHDNQEWKTPTGHFWSRPEMAEGPLLLQADHGPVAFRHVRVRPYKMTR